MTRLAIASFGLVLVLSACEGPEFNPPPDIPVRAADGEDDVVIQLYNESLDAVSTVPVSDERDSDVALNIGDDGCEANVDTLTVKSIPQGEVLLRWDLSERPLCRGDRLLWTGNELKLVEDAS